MRIRIIAAVILAAALPLTACSSGEAKAAATPQSELACSSSKITHMEWLKRCQAEESKAKAGDGKPAKETSKQPLGVGNSATFTFTDSYTEKKTTFRVTVNEVKYVGQSAEDDTTSPAEGQYVRLGITLKNTGQNQAHLLTYGLIEWEDADTAAQDATTLNIPEGPQLDTKYKPGQAVTGKLILDVPERGGVLNYIDGSGFTVKLPK
ncbi:DUF4352 domain-containing protein [Streptomyces sp. NBS 14/10]|uniref:DUF4352 domain-containing protein n=1 Tax=Streptomyces sp. NBS 14/10 TaxID=1945643 RepID=UPI0015C61222|nr:DUF4352 domain-containing protein [Streptomyces sp. NBS 14/10]KAK1184418.1 DUF4352 domain-containing protein [Streptomyces sp. NBS 14/10]